jgi:aminomethyltransferase
VTLRTSPLDSIHRELGAKLVPFGGWDMPLNYPPGTLAEHRACRTSAVVFDVSHLGTIRVTGRGAFDALQVSLTNDLGKIEPGRCQYTHLLDDDGSVLDDIIVWWVDDERFDVMPNASNTDRVTGALSGTTDGVEAVDVTATRAILAVQGPTARDLLATVMPDAAAVGRFRVTRFDFDGTECLAAGTGYTGEDGVELAVPSDRAADVWRAVTSAGVEPAGLGARDTLRLEAGLPLHGHELGPGITPLNAGLGWVVSWTKGDFRGRDALEAQRAAGVSPVLRGLLVEGRRPPRADQSVQRDGERVGTVSSGNFSPTLEHGIALAFVTPDVEVGDAVSIDMRGGEAPATVADLPFVAKKS